MQALSWAPLVMTASVLVSCGPVEHDPLLTTVGERQQRIIDGAPDDGDPAVVALVSGGKAACTGTLIADLVVLTAAHCLRNGTPSVVFGAGVTAPLATILPVDVRVHAGFDPDSLDNDIALILLGSPAPAAPVSLPGQTWVLTGADSGKAVRIVGFGLTSTASNDAGAKHSGTTLISAIDDRSFGLQAGPSHTCSGDSGGPALLPGPQGEILVGVSSSGSSTCTGEARQVRVDRYLADFVLPYVAQTAPGAAAPGDRCFYQENCARGQCYGPADGHSFSYCQGTCSADSECPQAMTCAASGVCEYAESGPGSAGSPCNTGYDCVSGVCARSAPGAGRICTVRCFPENAAPCTDGRVCLSNADSEHRYACFDKLSEGGTDTTVDGHGCSTRVTSRSDGGSLAMAVLVCGYVAAQGRQRRGTRSCGGQKLTCRKRV